MSSAELNSGYIQLLNAIKEKDKATAQNLILSNVSVNIPNSRDATPLHWAIQFEDLDIITMLLDRGANIHARNYRHQKPLEVAIEYNKIEAARLIIEKEAPAKKDLNSLLLMAVDHNNITIAEMLRVYGMIFIPFIDLNTPLNAAISQGKLEMIEQILSWFRYSPCNRYIPREVLIRFGPQYKQYIKLLLQWNFTVNPNDNHDEDFVYAAVEKGYLPIVLQLLEFGIDVNMMNADTGLNLLKVACINMDYEIAENLLKHNACVNDSTPTNAELLEKLLYTRGCHPCKFIYNEKKYNLHGITCLHIAVLNSDPETTKVLLKYGATIIDDPEFVNIIKIVVIRNCEEIFLMFLERVNVTDIDSEGKSLLHYCVLHFNADYDSRRGITKLLLEKGADVHLQTPGNSLLFEAIDIEEHGIAKLFLQHNADIQYINQSGDTLLHKAIEKHFDLEFMKAVLKLNLPVNAVNNIMLTPLHVACIMQSVYSLEIIKILLNYNANVNCTTYIKDYRKCSMIGLDDHHRTPLHFACVGITNLAPSIIELLLQHNANIEAEDAKGWTPLFVACEEGSDLAVKCLLDNHAIVNRTDLDNLTPLYIAAKIHRDNSKIVKMLLEHKANVHCMDTRGNSVIHVIINQNNVKSIKSLVDTQVNFNSVNTDGDTPLHIAVRRRKINAVNSLIKYGANVNILNKENQTPLKVAVKCKLKSDDTTVENIYKEMIKTFTIQIVKLKIAGLKVNNFNLKIVYDPDNYTTNDDEEDTDKINILRLEVKCWKEIEKMKTESIGVNNITFYNLLTRNIHFLCRFVKDKKNSTNFRSGSLR